MGRRVVVIGAGQAGHSLAAKLRDLGHSGPITLIGDEAEIPYQRPPLSKKYLLGEMTVERLHLKPRRFYAERNITLVTGERVEAIDRASREVVTAGRRLGYDVVALTTGAVPRRLPAAIGGDLAGVYTVRTLADVDAMRPEFAEGRRVLIVGGGYIGLEAAAVAAQKGLAVTLIEAAPRILGRVAAPETAEFFRRLHRSNGVDMREGTGLERLEGEDGRVARAVLAGGESLAVDFVVVGVGVDPATALAERTGLRIENGIAADQMCRTSDPAIFAAGDCASFPWRGGRVRLESVQNAIDMAEHAANAIHGATAPYRPVPWFWSDQYAARLQIAGLNLGYTRTVRRPGTRAGAESVWYFEGDRFLAVDAMNDPKAYMQGKRWLEMGHSPSPAAIADSALDLKTLAEATQGGR
ncbi:FAD-dependent oxidoreductase [Limibaculum sp. FT325]|uniref:NAD(P)/FAD-dependent oxidoreductase n=1 Tax=Thermohalobaculum sediminis TaxID=2939436 RepID=UPI0020BE96A2|nr:FAD-dependent oxidoreductase [Limibaculum sediminis]MCL5777906.1 FAD-dependent oxidoreductase [Limibaculum sediminis]